MSTEKLEAPEVEVKNEIPERESKANEYVVADPSEKENAKVLLKKVTWLMNSVKNNPAITILENILFNKGYMTTGDLEVYQIIATDIKGTFTINAKQLQKILKEIDTKESVSFGSSKIATLDLYVSGKKTFTLAAEVTTDFPKVPKCNMPIGNISNTEDFKSMNILQRYASDDDLRPAMKCIHVDNENMATTNGHLLTIKKTQSINLTEAKSMLIQSSLVKILNDFSGEGFIKAKYGEGEKEKSITNYSISQQDRAVVFINVDEKFPDYKNVLVNNYHIKLSVSKKTLLKHIKLAMLAANKTTHQGRFSMKFGEQVLNIESSDLDFGSNYQSEMVLEDLKWGVPFRILYEDKVDKESGEILAKKEEKKFGDAPAAGQEFEIGFNLKFLQRLVTDAEGDTIDMELVAANRAAFINDQHLIMPVMLN